jgi:ferredoxin
MIEFDSAWPAALHELAPEVHSVDRDALLIWFQIHPLGLLELAALEQFYQLRGAYRLADVAQTSHRFLYSHRYWRDAKRAVSATPLTGQASLLSLIRAVTAKINAPAGLALPIAAVALMTLRQAGPAFLSEPDAPSSEKRTPEQVLRDRASDAKSGFFAKRKPRVTFDESDPAGWFPIIPTQHITAAAEDDKRPYHEIDQRCYIGNGPIPVDCRSGTCGTCWVGILGGNEKLDPVEPFERQRMEYFGYWESSFHEPSEPRPVIRLACQTIANGSCSIVIPPWNGVWGKSRREASLRRRT